MNSKERRRKRRMDAKLADAERSKRLQGDWESIKPFCSTKLANRQNESALISLPVEILLLILERCDAKTICMLRATCRFMTMVDMEKLWILRLQDDYPTVYNTFRRVHPFVVYTHLCTIYVDIWCLEKYADRTSRFTSSVFTKKHIVPVWTPWWKLVDHSLNMYVERKKDGSWPSRCYYNIGGLKINSSDPKKTCIAPLTNVGIWVRPGDTAHAMVCAVRSHNHAPIREGDLQNVGFKVPFEAWSQRCDQIATLANEVDSMYIRKQLL